MKIVYDNTIDDCIAFHRFGFESDPIAKRFYRFILFLVPSIIVTIAVSLIVYLPPWAWPAPAMLFALSVLWFIDVPKRFRKAMDNEVIQNVESGKVKGVIGKHTIEISEKGIQETTDVNQSFSRWAGICGIKQNDSYIYVFIGQGMAYIVPKRAFTNEDNATEFYASICDYFYKANDTTA